MNLPDYISHFSQEQLREVQKQHALHQYTKEGTPGYEALLDIYAKEVQDKENHSDAARKAIDDSNQEIAKMKSDIASIKTSATCPILPSLSIDEPTAGSIQPRAASQRSCRAILETPQNSRLTKNRSKWIKMVRMRSKRSRISFMID